MKTIRQYPRVCESCHGNGIIPTTGYSNSTTMACPACLGSGVVTVTETIEDDWLEQIGKITPKPNIL